MRLARVRLAAVLVALLCLMACTDFVLNPISPQEARRQVIDVSRQVVSSLGGEVADATFGYKSCNDQGEAPFRGHSYLLLWMPGADRTREVSEISCCSGCGNTVGSPIPTFTRMARRSSARGRT